MLVGTATRCPQTERDRRIEVTTRDMTYGIGHRQHRQPESKRNPEKADPKTWEPCRDDCAATASEHQPKRPEKFGDHAPGHIALHGCWLLLYGMSLYLTSTGEPQFLRR